MVFYLKYRPQKIDDLDSESVRSALYSVLSLSDIPHAFLFTGPKGLGKTSAARILAKAVNCEDKSKLKNQNSKIQIKNKKLDEERAIDQRLTTNDHYEPCNECDQCISITNGSNLDILEIDAASNRGIDEIRDLREKIKLSPVSARKKVYIIDEVHMLTTEAFNALLKTLEEPPAHAMFILCTTELSKVPSTIQSRCFQIKFTQANTDDIARSFKRIIKGEKIKITDGAIKEITVLAEGGFRDAHKILEELVAMGEEGITVDLIEKKYKVVSSKYQVASLLKTLEEHDVKSGLDIVQKITSEGIDIKRFLQELTEAVHELLLQKAGVLGDSRFKIQDSRMEISEVRELLILLNRAVIDMKYAVLPQLPLELAIVDWGGLSVSEGARLRAERDRGGEKVQDKAKGEGEIANSRGHRAEGIGQRVEEQEQKQIEGEVKTTVTIDQAGVTVATMRKQVGDIARVKALYGEKKEEKGVNASQVNYDFSLLNVSNSEVTKEWLNNFWQVYISEIKQYNHTIAGVLRSCHIGRFDKQTLVIETAYKFHKERLDDGKTRGILENVCKTLTGSVMRVEIVLRES